MKKSTHKIREFSKQINDLCLKHKIRLQGQLLIDESPENTQEIEFNNQAYWGVFPVKDREELRFYSIPPKVEIRVPTTKSSVVIQDKDILLKNGVKSQADGKIYGNRREYNEHLKRHGMIEVGDQAPTKPNTEIRGDHECRREVIEAYKQHTGR